MGFAKRNERNLVVRTEFLILKQVIPEFDYELLTKDL